MIAVNESIDIAPLTAAQLVNERAAEGHIVVVLHAGGHEVDFETPGLKVQMFTSEKDGPTHQFSGKDLQQMAASTACPESVKKILIENEFRGDAGFCFNRIAIEKMNHFVLKRKGKSDKKATSALFDQTLDTRNILLYSIQFM